MRAAGVAASVLFAALALSACGDEPSKAEEQEDAAAAQIEAVAERFDAIVAAKDTKAFCKILAPSIVQRLGEGKSNGKKECLVVWSPAKNPLFEAKDPDLTVAEITKVKPPTATADLNNGGKLAFLHEQGAWHVSMSPGPGQGAGQ